MIIESMIDNDLYKFTMLQAILHQHPGAMVEYAFKCRTDGIDFRAYADKIIGEVNKMCRELRFTKEDLEYLGDLRFMKKDTMQFLKLFRFDYDYVKIVADESGQLHIRVKGPWLHTILFEIPILSIVSEVYSRDMSENFEEANNRTKAKVALIARLYEEEGIILPCAEFGGRRRHSVDAQRNALALLVEGCLMSRDKTGLVGTSNVMFAKEFGIPTIGTMAHEWGQAHQALYRIAESQFMALENWAKLFDGTRQDSGDPYEYGNAMIKHYKNMGIDPSTKTVVFSDGLDFVKAAELARSFNFPGAIKVSFGIGTHITNDFDFRALQIVLKMVSCNGNPVAKLSDTPAKGMCTDQGYVDYLQRTFDNRIS